MKNLLFLLVSVSILTLGLVSCNYILIHATLFMFLSCLKPILLMKK